MCSSHEREFQPYAVYVDSLVRMGIRLLERDDSVDANHVLDGHVASQLRKLVPLATRRATGAFFTPSDIASRAVGLFDQPLDARARVYDGACGTGDLLLPIAKELPLYRSMSATIERWGDQLRGADLRPEFVRATRIRLLVALLSRYPRRRALKISFADVFPNIRCADSTVTNTWPTDLTHVVLNPSYARVDAPRGAEWAHGRITAAAHFLEIALGQLPAAAEAVVVLPDVVRTGSNYALWREHMRELSRGRKVSIRVVGRFDRHADVDVFLFHARQRSGDSPPRVRWWPTVSASRRLGDVFDVHVGAVVPHRDRGVGAWRPYLDTGLAPMWSEIRVAELPHRRFDRRCFTPPFVVIRRTSAAGDVERAVASIVRGREAVAVENHLIVARPKDRSVKTCLRLMRELEQDGIAAWLNRRIRCRHLTVDAVAGAPWK